MDQLDKSIERLETAFSTTMRKVGAELSDDGEMGLTRTQFYILHLLSRKEKFMVTEIASEMHVKPSAVTVMIERLRKNGLVSRERDEEDRRVVYIRLTDKGWETLKLAGRKRRQVLARYLGRLEEEELAKLVEIYEKLARIADSIEN